MSNYRKLSCEACSFEFLTARHTGPSAAKRCKLCRFITAQLYMIRADIHTSECEMCGNQFAPLKVPGDKLCADHAHFDIYVGGHAVPGHCNWCDQDVDNVLDPEVPICVGCAKKPSNRKKFRRWLDVIQQKHREDSGHGHGADELVGI